MKFNTAQTMNKDLDEDETSLSKYENNPQKTQTKSLTKLNLASPVKHTISSLNKTRTKESIERELHQKREEKEYGF